MLISSSYKVGRQETVVIEQDVGVLQLQRSYKQWHNCTHRRGKESKRGINVLSQQEVSRQCLKMLHQLWDEDSNSLYYGYGISSNFQINIGRATTLETKNLGLSQQNKRIKEHYRPQNKYKQGEQTINWPQDCCIAGSSVGGSREVAGPKNNENSRQLGIAGQSESFALSKNK